MGYAAQILHKTRGRVRLQMAKKADDENEWDEVLERVRNLSRSAKVRGNRMTHTMVLEAQDELGLEEALRAVGEAGLLDLAETTARVQKNGVWELPVKEVQEVCDSFLRQISEGKLDLRATLGFGLLALGIRQSLTAKFLPAGLTLLIYALTFLKRPEAQQQE